MLPTLPRWRACQLALYREEWRLTHTHIELRTHKQNHRRVLAKTDCVCVYVWAGVWTVQDGEVHQTHWQSIVRWAGKQVCSTPVTQLKPTQQRPLETICDWQVQVCGGEVPEPRPGGQRFGPPALHEGGAPALCWWAAEPELNSAALQLCGQLVQSLFNVFTSLRTEYMSPGAWRALCYRMTKTCVAKVYVVAAHFLFI